MGFLGDREKGFEEKFAYDEEVAFKIRARRNKLFASWAAEAMCLPDSEKEQYVSAFLEAAVKTSDDSIIIKRISDDLLSKETYIKQSELLERLEDFHKQAKDSILGGKD